LNGDQKEGDYFNCNRERKNKVKLTVLFVKKVDVFIDAAANERTAFLGCHRNSRPAFRSLAAEYKC